MSHARLFAYLLLCMHKIMSQARSERGRRSWSWAKREAREQAAREIYYNVSQHNRGLIQSSKPSSSRHPNTTTEYVTRTSSLECDLGNSIIPHQSSLSLWAIKM